MKKLSLFVCVLALGACGGFLKPPVVIEPPKTDSGTSVADAGTRDGGLPPAEACRALNTNRCAYFIRCGLVEDTMEGRDACLRELEVTWCGPMTWPAHVAAGALRFEASTAEFCGTAFATWSCDEFATLPESCLTFLKPRQGLHEPCWDGFSECLDGVCRGATCPRHCEPRGFQEEPCASDAECRAGLFCRLSPFSTVSGQCAPFGANGATCLSDGECLIGLHCVDTLCRELPSVSQPCLAGRCIDNAWCDSSVGDGGTCAVRKGETALCDGDQCNAALQCDALAGRCLRPSVGAGDPCSPSQACPSGMTCLHVTAVDAGTCANPQGNGMDCVSSADCQAHLFCGAVDGGRACQARQSAGATCSDERECKQTAVCLKGACAERGLPLDACSDELPCRWGLCRDEADGGGVCGSKRGAGQACELPDECASGLCDNHLCIGRCLP